MTNETIQCPECGAKLARPAAASEAIHCVFCGAAIEADAQRVGQSAAWSGLAPATDLSFMVDDAADSAGEAEPDIAIANEGASVAVLEARHGQLLTERDGLLAEDRGGREKALAAALILGAVVAAPFLLPMPNLLRIIWFAGVFLIALPLCILYWIVKKSTPSPEEVQRREENARRLAAVEAEMRAIGKRLRALGAPIDTRADR